MKIEFENLLNLSELTVTDIALTDKKIIIHCESCLNEALCPSCLEKCNEVKSYYTRTIRDLPMMGRVVVLKLTVRQFYCPDCDHYFQERFSFVDPSKTMTKRYEEYLYNLCKITSIQKVCLIEDLVWDVVQSVFERYAQLEIQQTQRIKEVRWLGIDEFSLKKGHKDFACVLVDLQRACVIDVLKHRDKAYVKEHLLGYGQSFLENIEVFSSDMWDGYIALAKELMPNAIIVIDRFHVSAQLNKALNDYRKSLRRNYPDTEDFKRLRWILLKPAENLSDSEKEILQKAFAHCEELERFYLLKESFRQIFDAHIDRQTANNLIDIWIEQAEALENQYLNRFLKTLQRWKTFILNFFIHRVSNAIVEGINNTIKFIKRRAYGYLNFKHFYYRVMIECGDFP